MLRRLILVVLLATGAEVSADSFWMDMQETDDLRLLYFDPTTTYLVPHATRSFQNSLEYQRRMFNWTPSEKVTVMLQDFMDYGNAAALSSTSNVVWVDVAPLKHTFETFPAVERMYMLMNHELVHVATGDVATEQDKKWRQFFGGKPYPIREHPETLLYHFLSTPRNVAPRWYFEGTAVFMETWMSGGIGRAQGAYDEMKFRAQVRDGQKFYSNLGLAAEGTNADFQTATNAYFYGTRFMSYLAYTYSPEQVIEWIRRDEGSKRYYSNQFRHVFGKDLESAWQDWIVFETEYQRQNLAEVRKVPLTPTKPLIDRALGSVSRAYVDKATNTLLGGFYYPGVVGHIGSVNLGDGSTRRITDIKVPMKYKVTSLAYDEKNQVIFYTADNLKKRDLMTVDLAGGKPHMLMKDVRIGDLSFNRADQSLWGVRTENGFVQLVRIPPPYTEWTAVNTWPYGRIISDIDVSPDGTLLSATMEEVDGTQYLRLFSIEELLAGKIESMAEFGFGRAVPESFVFSPDGKYLFGSSYYTGVSNIFRYEVANGDVQAVSNAETGFFLPIPLEDGSLIVFEYTGQGFVPTRIDPVPLEDLSAIRFLGNEIVRKHPVVTEWSAGSPARIDLAALDPQHGEYHPSKQMTYATGYPIIEGYRDTFALGFSVLFEDPMMFSSLKADVSYSIDGSLPSSEKLHVDVEYHTLDWRFRYWHNDADFYDLFGPTERARKGDAFIVGYARPLIYDGPRRLDLDVETAYYTGLDTLPGNQNIDTQFEDLLSARAELKFRHTQQSLGAVDHEQGIRWDLAGYVDHANGEVIPKIRGGFDFGFALPVDHASLWLYSAAGLAGGDRENSLGNWYFGAFGNNYVDDGDVKRYRNFYSFPGFEIDQLAGQDFAKSVLELNLPPLRFDNIGVPSVFMSSARPALFVGAMTIDMFDSEFKETYFNFGVQIDFQFTIMHRQSMTLSVGYAQGYIGSDKADDEFMISLKVL